MAKLEQEAQRQKQTAPAAHSYLERRAVRGGGGSHHAQEVRAFPFVCGFIGRRTCAPVLEGFCCSLVDGSRTRSDDSFFCTGPSHHSLVTVPRPCAIAHIGYLGVLVWFLVFGMRSFTCTACLELEIADDLPNPLEHPHIAYMHAVSRQHALRRTSTASP